MTREIVQEFHSANLIKLTLKHNGFKGGDTGHGGFVDIKIENEGSTDMSVNGEHESEYLHLIIRGDTERDTFLDAFKAIVKELEDYKMF